MKAMRVSLIMCTLMIPGAVATPASAKTLQIVASFSVLADVVQQIGGRHVQVRSLVAPNGDPHQYEPSPADAKDLNDADLTFISGEGLERWFEKLAKASGYRGTPVIVSTGIELRERTQMGEISDDPHVWNSPINVMVWVSNIEMALAAGDPADADDFKANAARYTTELHDLDAYAHAHIDPIPLQQRQILTSHNAFGYLGRDYGITFLSPLGLSTETEASAGTVAKLIDQVKAEHIKVYFIQNSNDPRLVQQIADATGAKPGGKLYAEALSAPDGPAPTYIQMFRHNVDALVGAMTASSAMN
jgi:zinc/manganese transport system substrate-binding protein